MFDLFAKFRKTKVWDFDGGIHPPEMKDQTRLIPIRRPALPDYLQIPLQQHLGPEGELLVKQGEYVFKGQKLTTGKNRALPVHASTSGTVIDIGYYPSTHPSAIPERCIRLKPDGLEQWAELQPLDDYLSYTPGQLIEHIHRSGIAGLGGAVFPTASKINDALSRVNTLIINGAECEPYITADDRLMQEYANELIIGCEILRHILKPESILIGIEDNKPEAIQQLKQALQRNGSSDISLRVIPTKYPSGGAKQLTKILTGLEVPHGGRSSDIGVLMQNVGTVYAIKRAVINGEPLIERIVTLTGEALQDKGNFWVLLGTPVSELLQQLQYQPQTKPMVIMGGPLMGFALPDMQVPVTKMSNCIIAPSSDEIEPPQQEQACIRCTQCADACPAGLLPQQLYWFSRGKEHEKARNYNLFDCIECGACAYVCPSNIPLVQYYRQEKAEIREQDQLAELARTAKIRFEARQARLEKEKLARQQRHKQAETRLDDKDNHIIQAALERVKQQNTVENSNSSTIPVIKSVDGKLLPDNSAVIALRQARKAQRQASQLVEQSEVSVDNNVDSEQDSRKAALAAAIARAKAKKEQKQQAEIILVEQNISETSDTDDRKNAVAEAIARVKARKAQQHADSVPVVASVNPKETTVSQQVTVPVDDRKAAVAEAIARAKARKEQREEMQQQSESSEQQQQTIETQPVAEVDERKAAVAEAIARVKARKAQQAALQLTATGEE
ncbi:electron transport complex subunit RsxC [Budviciaceae bacterium CWB-B4]|uniref:Ion-translocating oxidoreductase complex subunit C n=1 Tax=Limnobaculum xujianqingii TaxID=2738837 RepID=A0A9D7FSQ9_9GAMM|nr:electron transport complex subunit RsxC [Limnobaculum xujianqingii]MBK5072914.1 electron transport complex subunit RsxC [Limnobaculum xujianqingii]MBK5176223.1 electron transport complex subunit RsxC [Limnobaculum xujianqingii]